jgi:hypothetical protein
MTRPGNDMTASGHGRFRASRADREQVIATLKAAYVYGCLTKDEFDLRVTQTFDSRTYAELALVTADIPAGLGVEQPSGLRRAGKTRARASLPANDRAAIAAAVLSAVAMAISLLIENPAGGIILLAAAASAFTAVALAVRQHRHASPRDISGGPTPSQPAVDADANTSRPRQIPPRREGTQIRAGRFEPRMLRCLSRSY